MHGSDIGLSRLILPYASYIQEPLITVKGGKEIIIHYLYVSTNFVITYFVQTRNASKTDSAFSTRTPFKQQQKYDIAFFNPKRLIIINPSVK